MFVNVDHTQFEVVGHKFADLSEYGLGCALVNNAKYGYSCFKVNTLSFSLCGSYLNFEFWSISLFHPLIEIQNLLRLSLLRSPKRPDANTDIHRHFIQYCLLPHGESLQESEVIPFSQNYNQPLRYIEHKPTECGLEGMSFFNVSTKEVVLDTVKMTQDGTGDVVLRMYEAFGGRTECVVKVGFDVQRANLCNLLEDVAEEVSVSKQENGSGGCRMTLFFEPFEIKSVRLSV